MPKTTDKRMTARTTPGVSYVVPTAKLVDTACVEDAYTYLVALDPLEEVFLDTAAREVIQATEPGYRGAYEVPVITWNGRTCLRVMGRFPPVLKGPDGKPRKTVKAGSTITIRVMLKAWPSGDAVSVVAYPSRIDVHSASPAGGTRKPSAPVQLAMTLPPPAEPVVEPAPVTKPRKVVNPKAPPKPRCASAPKPMSRATKADFAAHRARVVEARQRALKAKAETPAPVKGPTISQRAHTAATCPQIGFDSPAVTHAITPTRH